jgi:hypothetical protein
MSSREDESLLLPQNQIHDPTAGKMLSWLAAVGQNVGVGAARLFRGIGQYGHYLESPLVVDAAGEGQHAWRPPNGVEGDGMEGITEDFPKQAGGILFRFLTGVALLF